LTDEDTKMNRSNAFFILTMAMAFVCTGILGCAGETPATQRRAGESPARPGPYSWRQTENSLALLNDGNTVWQLNYDKRYDKPYFHPIALTDGTVLTDLGPADHPWHRGLWWSWKFINGVNYWEEDPKTRLAPGRSEITGVKVTTRPDGNAEAQFTVEYHPPGKAAIVTEKRKLKVSAPDEKGVYRIDWTSTFAAGDCNVLFGRTPIIGEPCGVVWGGYAGLSVRMAKDAGNWRAADSEGHIFDKEFNNAKARWLDYTIQAGPAGTEGGVAILDHPSNPRHPTTWYVILGDPMRYFSPALIYDQPFTLAAGRTLKLRYRVIVHPGPMNRQWLENEWAYFRMIKR
jgi:hypothetical protein